MKACVLFTTFILSQSDERGVLEKKSKYYSTFAAAANCIPDNLVAWRCPHYCSGQVTDAPIVFRNDLMNTQMYIKVNAESKDIILGYRATKDLKNWLIDGLAVPVPTWFMSPKYMVHSGFLVALKALSKKYLPIVKQLAQKYADYNIVFTGHSLGGALATVGMLDVKHNLNVEWDRLNLFTYGQPRVGNQQLAEYINLNLKNSARYVNKRDPVPHVPPKGLLGFTHHHSEIWFSDELYFSNNNVMEDPAGASQVRSYKVDDHMFAWDLQFSLDC